METRAMLHLKTRNQATDISPTLGLTHTPQKPLKHFQQKIYQLWTWEQNSPNKNQYILIQRLNQAEKNEASLHSKSNNLNNFVKTSEVP